MKLEIKRKTSFYELSRVARAFPGTSTDRLLHRIPFFRWLERRCRPLRFPSGAIAWARSASTMADDESGINVLSRQLVERNEGRYRHRVFWSLGDLMEIAWEAWNVS